MTPSKDQHSFSKMFDELERISKEFEQQDKLDIDASLKKFERGLEIASLLKKRLSDVELQVKKIKEKFSDPT